jgi:hypothetical protein
VSFNFVGVKHFGKIFNLDQLLSCFSHGFCLNRLS